MKNSEIIDISMPFDNEMLMWPGISSFKASPFKKISEGASSNITQFSMTTHCGTHVDAPLHLFEKGLSMENILLDTFIGNARLYNAGLRKKIDRKFLEKLNFEGVERALFRSINSAYLSEKKFRKNYVYFSEDAARFLVEKKIKLLGTDYLSIENFSDKERPAHRILLEAGIIILEGINLLNVREGDYELICLPLNIVGGDGAPARAVLRKL